MVAPADPLVTWVLDQLEDNVFYSAESGYNVKDIEKNWFGFGAVTLQPCLVDLPRLYMNRNENPASLRAFWNAYALLIYPDVQCFAEWAKAFGRGGGPVYKTADESRFCIWFRQFLVNEDGDDLWLARGTPRAGWPTEKRLRWIAPHLVRRSLLFDPVEYLSRRYSGDNHFAVAEPPAPIVASASSSGWFVPPDRPHKRPGGFAGRVVGDDILLTETGPRIDIVAQYPH